MDSSCSCLLSRFTVGRCPALLSLLTVPPSQGRLIPLFSDIPDIPARTKPHCWLFPFLKECLTPRCFLGSFCFFSSQNKPLSGQEAGNKAIETRYRKHCCTRTASFSNTRSHIAKSVTGVFLTFRHFLLIPGAIHGGEGSFWQEYPGISGNNHTQRSTTPS